MSDPIHTRIRQTSTFAVGDRVRLKASGADNWIDHRLQRRARAGTPAVVTVVVGTGLHPCQRSYRIVFDAVGRMQPMSEIIPVQQLEALQDV